MQFLSGARKPDLTLGSKHQLHNSVLLDAVLVLLNGNENCGVFMLGSVNFLPLLGLAFVVVVVVMFLCEIFH